MVHSTASPSAMTVLRHKLVPSSWRVSRGMAVVGRCTECPKNAWCRDASNAPFRWAAMSAEYVNSLETVHRRTRKVGNERKKRVLR